MFPFTIKTLTLFLFITLTFGNGQDRQIVSKLNPDCDDCKDDQNPLIYTRAEGPDDTIHQIWDFTDYVPSVVYIIGSPNSTLKITWKNNDTKETQQPDTFQFSESSADSYSFAAAIDSIIEYNDLKDNGQYEPDMPETWKRHWRLTHTSWNVTGSVFTDKEAMVALRGYEKKRTGLIEMKLDLLPFKEYAVELPHLIHTANSTLVDVRLVNWTEHRGFNSSRFALRLVLASSDPTWGSWTRDTRKSLDDEHTPGVFEIIELKSSREWGGGFVQFRPVAYTEPEREVSSSTNAYISNFNKSSLPEHGILRKLYRDYLDRRHPYSDDGPVNLVRQDAVVSFGLGGDGFYKHHNFTAWSFSIGYGDPPVERFSLVVVVIISIGLGAPVVLALAGVAYLVARRYRQTNAPARFHNND